MFSSERILATLLTTVFYSWLILLSITNYSIGQTTRLNQGCTAILPNNAALFLAKAHSNISDQIDGLSSFKGPSSEVGDHYYFEYKLEHISRDTAHTSAHNTPLTSSVDTGHIELNHLPTPNPNNLASNFNLPSCPNEEGKKRRLDSLQRQNSPYNKLDISPRPTKRVRCESPYSSADSTLCNKPNNNARDPRELDNPKFYPHYTIDPDPATAPVSSPTALRETDISPTNNPCNLQFQLQAAGLDAANFATTATTNTTTTTTPTTITTAATDINNSSKQLLLSSPTKKKSPHSAVHHRSPSPHVVGSSTDNNMNTLTQLPGLFNCHPNPKTDTTCTALEPPPHISTAMPKSPLSKGGKNCASNRSGTSNGSNRKAKPASGKCASVFSGVRCYAIYTMSSTLPNARRNKL
jgi:hypothetical protein